LEEIRRKKPPGWLKDITYPYMCFFGFLERIDLLITRTCELKREKGEEERSHENKCKIWQSFDGYVSGNSAWICIRCLEKLKAIPPNGGLIVIYHGRKKTNHLKQIQVFCSSTFHSGEHTMKHPSCDHHH